MPLGSYLSEVLPLSAQRVINWIPVVSESEALSPNSLVQRAGLSDFSGTNEKQCRGLHVVAGVLFSVNGNALFKISSTGVATNLGYISGSNRVVMADNGTTLVIVVPGGNSYTWDGVTLTAISDPDFPTRS